MIINDPVKNIDAENGVEKSSASPPSKIQQANNKLQSMFNNVSRASRNDRRLSQLVNRRSGLIKPQIIVGESQEDINNRLIKEELDAIKQTEQGVGSKLRVKDQDYFKLMVNDDNNFQQKFGSVNQSVIDELRSQNLIDQIQNRSCTVYRKRELSKSPSVMKRDTISIFKIGSRLSNAQGPYVASAEKNNKSQRQLRSLALPEFQLKHQESPMPQQLNQAKNSTKFSKKLKDQGSQNLATELNKIIEDQANIKSRNIENQQPQQQQFKTAEELRFKERIGYVGERSSLKKPPQSQQKRLHSSPQNDFPLSIEQEDNQANVPDQDQEHNDNSKYSVSSKIVQKNGVKSPKLIMNSITSRQNPRDITEFIDLTKQRLTQSP